MYGINTLLKKYPLAEKAFASTESYIEQAFFMMGGEAACVAAPKMIMEIIDQNIDGTDAEKQALIIGAFYALSPKAIMNDAAAFKSTYDAETNAVLATMMPSVLQEKSLVACTSTSRINMALGIPTLAALSSILEDGGAAITREAAQEMKDKFAAEEKGLLPNLNAPRLEALYQTTKQKFFAILDKSSTAPQPKKPKKPGGPKT
jgi:hypothetical protein